MKSISSLRSNSSKEDLAAKVRRSLMLRPSEPVDVSQMNWVEYMALRTNLNGLYDIDGGLDAASNSADMGRGYYLHVRRLAH